MQVFNESVNTIHHEGTRNSLVVTSKHELFFGVFNVKVNDNFYVVEQVGEYDECPVVKIPVTIDGNVEERLFDLVVGRESKVIFNESISNFDMLQEAENIQEESLDIFNKPAPVITDAAELSQEEIGKLIHGDSKTIKESFEVESPIKYGRYPVEIEKIATDLQETVGKLQENAKKVIQEYTNKQLKKLKSLNENDNGSADALLKSAKADLVEEFVKITTEIKSELTNSNVDSRKDITTTLDRKLATAINEFDEKINRQFDQYTKIYNDTISKYIDVVLEDQYKPKLQSFIDTTKTELVETFQELSEEVASQVNEKVGVKDWNELNQIFSNNSQMLIQANIELNNKIQNVASQIVAEHVIDQKISESISGIETHFSNNIQSINEKIDTLDDATREHFLGIIAESRNLLLQEIATIKQNAAVEYVIESKTKQEKLDITTLKSDLLKDLDSKISNAIVNLKKFTTYYGGGGGTVAQQFADGGTMNGNLTVVGAISASQYLGISIPTGDYLPLSGGTVTGNVTVTGQLSADRIYTNQIDALSANITVIDIKQYELSGFNVAGNVTINGAVSATSLTINSLTATNATISGNISASGTVIASNYNPASNVAFFLAAPTSSNLAAAVTDETGTNSLVFNTNPTLSGATMAGSLGINATSFSFGVSSRENFLTKLSNRFVYKNEPIPYAEIFDDFPTVVTQSGTHRWVTTAGTVAYYTNGTAPANFWGAISMTTGATIGNSSGIVLGTSGGSNGQTSSRINISFQTCFCVSVSACEYRQSLNGGGGSYAIAAIFDTGVLRLESPNIGGAGINTLTVASGLSLSAGNFISGTRYRLFFKPLSLTQCEVYFASAPWNSSTWTTLVDTIVTHPTVANSAVCAQPFATVVTKASSAAIAYLDWVAIRQEIQR